MVRQENQHVRYIVFDKDNTLTLPYRKEVPAERRGAIIDSIAACFEIFGPSSLAILSNSAGSKDDANFEDALEIETAFEEILRHHTQ
mmetsp:Transcript_11325/g.19076  ORF Transcript_11325/g.19076 Transcript_11325/m.19076 type:complete len:87 (+) Transcript_11325:157-417(+)